MASAGRIERIAIVGGGTAGWIAASLLARQLGASCRIELIESPDIPTIGVGEATIPGILEFLRLLRIDQNDFVAEVQATYKLGIQFIDWHHIGHRYWHPFGAFGVGIDRLPFHHFWHKARALGVPEEQKNRLNLEIAMAEAGKFIFPQNTLGIAQNLRYALHFDAGRVAGYLRRYAEALGVRRLERNVAGATLREDGFIDEIVLTDGGRIKADLYIDCTGFRGLLIEQTLRTGYVDWSHLLPNDRAVAVQVPNKIPRPPYTIASARSAGWHWRIPLQHRVGTGYVYSSSHVSDAAAMDDLLSMAGSELLTEPRVIRFVTGHRKQFWSRNCVALGLASGFIEPLESTSIQLIVSGLYNLLDHFPDMTFDPVNIADYNAQVIWEFERVRDFILLHYCTTARSDSEYWRACQQLELPEDLAARMDLYRRTGRIYPKRYELFVEWSWFFVMDGMGLRPRDYDPLVDGYDFEQVKRIFEEVRSRIAADVAAAPSHDSFFRPVAGQNVQPAMNWK
jgi:tryptophan halogenase